MQMITVHGRTREQGYKGAAEYDTIAAVKRYALRIPVVANGDIGSPRKSAATCSRYTGADAVMIGRAAQGRPWIFRESGALPGHRHASCAAPCGRSASDCWSTTCATTTICTASSPVCARQRKHIGWYVKTLPGGEAFRRAEMNVLEDCEAQLAAVSGFFEELGTRMDRIPARYCRNRRR